MSAPITDGVVCIWKRSVHRTCTVYTSLAPNFHFEIETNRNHLTCRIRCSESKSKLRFSREKRWNEKDFKSVTNREQIFPLVRCHWIATTDANRNIVFGRSFVGFVVGSLLHFCDQNANDTVDAMWTRTFRSLINFSPNKRIKPDYVDVTCTFACTRAFF